MERRVMGIGMGMCIVLLASGCPENKKKLDADTQAASSDYGLDYVDPSTTASTYDSASTSDPYSYSSGTDASLGSTTTYASGGGRVHVVKKKETLSSIANQYYGVRNWRKIYEANRDRITDPNVIHPGMELVIP
jgi:nucleoid-associated protein YgaU